MTPPDLAARVAALLDAGDPGHVRDLYEDLAAEMGEAEAARAVREALMAWRIGRILAWADMDDPALWRARALSAELAAFLAPEGAGA